MNNGRFSIAVMISLIACFGSASAPAADELLSGSARVADGDTIEINAQRIRLEGIDAPETDQVCLDAKGQSWTCGITARDILSSHIAGRIVSCTARGEDRYGRMLATCLVGGENLNAFMVREGLDYAKYSGEYTGEEDTAREQRRGMWAGAFIAPWDWRPSGQEHRHLRCSFCAGYGTGSTLGARLIGHRAIA